MKHIQLFEAYNETFTAFLPPRVSAPNGEYVFAELSDSDTGDRLLGIVDNNTLQGYLDMIEEAGIADKILECMEEGEIVQSDSYFSYHVRNLDQEILKGREEAMVSFFCDCGSCKEKINDILMGYSNNLGVTPDKRIEDGVTVYSGMFKAGKETVIVHQGDSYLLGHAPLQDISEWPGQHDDSRCHNYTMPFTIDRFYRQPYPGEPYEEGGYPDTSRLDTFYALLQGDKYALSYNELNPTVLKEILNLLLEETRAPEAIIHNIIDYFKYNPSD